MSPARISKYPPIGGLSLDSHQVEAPFSPPVPPAPPPAKIPSYVWAVVVGVPVCGFFPTGKWSWYKVTTEGLGNILVGHDWGMFQSHIPVPVIATPSIAKHTIGSSTKYWLPSTPNKDPQCGSVPGGDGSVAVSTPAWCMTTLNCQDIAGWPFVLPTSTCFQMPSTREVGFTWGDLISGVIGMVGDCVGKLAGKALGDKFGSAGGDTWKDALSSALRGALVGAGADLLSNLVPDEPKWAKDAFKVVVSGAAFGGLDRGLGDTLGAAAGPAISGAAGGLGGEAQESMDGNRPPDR